MLFSLVEAHLRQVKWSSWLKSMCIRREMFTPSPGQQWELAATRTTVWGELAVPMWEKKGKCAEKYNNKCEMSSSKSLSCVLLALAGLPIHVCWVIKVNTHWQTPCQLLCILFCCFILHLELVKSPFSFVSCSTNIISMPACVHVSRVTRFYIL